MGIIVADCAGVGKLLMDVAMAVHSRQPGTQRVCPNGQTECTTE